MRQSIQKRILVPAAAAILVLTGCKSQQPAQTIQSLESQERAATEEARKEISESVVEDLQKPTENPLERETMNPFNIEVNGKILQARFEQNPSAKAFYELLKQGPVQIAMEDYAHFEKVGSLPQSLVCSDEPITTKPGDVILYQGNQITIYYDVNQWNFTRLGEIQDITPKELKNILGKGGVGVTFFLPEEGK